MSLLQSRMVLSCKCLADSAPVDDGQPGSALDGMNVKEYFTFVPSETTLYDLAEGQAGYFTTRQAEGISVSRQLLQHHLRSGTIQRAAHGVYRLTNFPHQPFEDIVATILWAGEGAVASHETALAVYRLGDAMPENIHLTLPRRFRGKRPGVVAHTAVLATDEHTKRDGIAVTTVERTLADVAGASDPSIARSALHDALERGLTNRRRLDRYISSHPDLAPAALRLLAVAA